MATKTNPLDTDPFIQRPRVWPGDGPITGANPAPPAGTGATPTAPGTTAAPQAGTQTPAPSDEWPGWAKLLLVGAVVYALSKAD